MYRADVAPDRSILVTAFNGQLFGLDRSTGEVRWGVSDTIGAGIYEIAIEGGVVIVASLENVAFVDYTTGHVHAVVKIEGEHARRPTMVVDGGMVYIARDGEMTCFSSRGQRMWHQPFKGKGFGPIALGFPGNVRQADDPGFR